MRGAAAGADRLPLDGAVVPGLLLLVARHLALFDPPRVLAWRLLHLETFAGLPERLGPFFPRPAGGLDRDPIALVLASAAALLALAYLAAAALGARPRVRAALLGLAALVIVVLPTLAFVALGAATGRPYGQDGGVVQLPLAIDRILAGQTPYGADYSATILGRQARVSDFWSEHGGNPILHHHAYLPGTHLLVLPFVPLSRALFGTVDPRLATLFAWIAAALLAAFLAPDAPRRLSAAAAVLVSPLVYWQQVFGANDVLAGALLLGAVHLARRERRLAAAAVLGLACATKQLAWPFAPFLLGHLSGARTLPELISGPALRRLARPLLVTAAVFAAVVLPVAALDFRAFWGDIVVYNVGLPGGDNYPLGGTPGFGFANFLIAYRAVSSLRDSFPFGAFYVVLVPLGLLLLARQLREGRAEATLLTGSAALLLSLYVSRVVHPNYLILAAVLVPAALCATEGRAASGLLPALLLLAVAVEVAEGEVLRAAWTDAAPRLAAALGPLAPTAGPDLTRDPLGLLLSATAAGLAVGLFVATVLGATGRARLALVALALAVVVAAPTAVIAAARPAGVPPRLEDPWGAALADASVGTSGAAQQAWSVSFKKDPPGPADTSAAGPLARPLGRLLGALRLRDPRWPPLVAALALAGALARRPRAGATTPVALAVALLTPAAVLGLMFGSWDLVLLALVLAARPLGAVAAPAAAAVWLALARDWTALGPGLGWGNLALYAGLPPGTRAFAFAVPAVIGAALAALALRRASPLVIVAVLLVAALSLSPGGSPGDVAAPIALAALAALGGTDSRG